MFSSVAFQIQNNRIIIEIKATFYKEIVQFTILVVIVGNKSSKYFFLIIYIKVLSNFKI